MIYNRQYLHFSSPAHDPTFCEATLKHVVRCYKTFCTTTMQKRRWWTSFLEARFAPAFFWFLFCSVARKFGHKPTCNHLREEIFRVYF